MKNSSVVVALAFLLAASLSCKFLKDKVPATSSGAPNIDFTAPSKGIDVRVDLDKKQSSNATIGKAGGSVSWTAADGSKFKLDVPPNALDGVGRLP